MPDSIPRPELTVPLPGELTMRFRQIVAPGERAEFLMGSRGNYADEEPRHRVVLTVPYWMGVFPVTQEEYTAVMRNNPSDFKDSGPRAPVENVSWEDAMAFCGKLMPPEGWVATLPTEAQWEHACRAGTETEYHTGDGETALEAAGWYDGNSRNRTHPVGEKERNGFGLFDLHGNVWEWCRDGWDDEAYRKRVDGVQDPWPPDEGRANRVLRGGSWFFAARLCRSAFRGGNAPALRTGLIGFRICLVPGPEGDPSGQPDQPGEASSGPGVRRREAGRRTEGAEDAGEDGIDLARERLPGEGD